MAVVSAITCVVLVLATGAGSFDTVGKLGISELHEVRSRISRRYLTVGLVSPLIQVQPYLPGTESPA